MTITTPVASVEAEFLLDEPLLERCRERAPMYDRENRFLSEDFEELRAAGYLRICIPSAYGGGARTLAQYAREVMRLASYAPPSALSTHMHNYWMGGVSDMLSSGDYSLDWMLEEGAAGEVFANGHGERGNDLNGFLSTVDATRVDGGYRFTGHKIFGSLSPVWTRFALWGMDTKTAGGPYMVHAAIRRDAPGYRIVETWDTLGMRATQSHDTVLEGVVAPDRYIIRVLGPGAVDNMLGTLFPWIEVGFAAVYAGIASRAIELASDSARSRKSIGLTRPMAYHPEIQHEMAEMFIAQEAAASFIERVAREAGTPDGLGPMALAKCFAVKHFVTEAAQRVVDLAMRISGGSGMFRSNELERLFRDVRCGGFHPANSMFAHEMIGKMALGIDPGEQPRWG